jgi:peptide methionine sulfoxide reductase msrA/msrB
VKKPSAEELKKKLTPEQFKVTQQEGTERAFHNQYWNHKEAGIYVDVVSGEPLFSSLDKYDSGTGWPSFTKPIDDGNVVTREDGKLFMKRTEVRSKEGDSHLGHVFDDGPGPSGQRFCMNSAALRFVPVDRLEAEGYGKYLALFAGVAGAPGKKGASPQTKPSRETATFAGGCFWGMEELLRSQPGVVDTHVGYTGGSLENPTYEKVKKGNTGHAESIEVIFDSTKTTYEQLVRFFFKIHDPTTLNRQGNDVGTQYRSAIFYHSAQQKEVAEKVKAEVDGSGKWKKPIVTEIIPFTKFTLAEDYHQK